MVDSKDHQFDGSCDLGDKNNLYHYYPKYWNHEKTSRGVNSYQENLKNDDFRVGSPESIS